MQKQYVRVLKTDSVNEIVKNMVGEVLEVNSIYYQSKTINVHIKDKSDWFTFTFDEVQLVFPECIKDGYVIGVGDVIIYTSGKNEYIVEGAQKRDGEYILVTHKKGEEDNTYIIGVSEDFTVEPLYKQSLSGKEVTVNIDGKDYEAIIK